MTIVTTPRDIPDFNGLSADEAWAACEEWEDWMYSHLADDSDFSWDWAVSTARDNYDRYYAKYEG